MAENMNSYGGVVGGVAVTAVNSITPTIGTCVPAPDSGSVGEVKLTPSNAVFSNSSNAFVGSGDPANITSNVDSSTNNPEGLVPQVDGVSVTTVQSSSVASVDGANTGPPPPGTLPVATTGVKKTSFQITSVTVDSSASNDGGDDSADDLDESHTEDSSDVATDASRHTSESRAPGGPSQPNDDNFTRNDIFYNPAPPSSMNIAPVIPTSSQYGLAIVPEGLNPVTETPPPAPAIMSDPSADKSDPDKDIVHNRFKVVKIVSTEPFKKGRWMCMDYFDHTTTTSGTSTAVKEGAQTQPAQQGVTQSLAHGSIQPPAQVPGDKPATVNVVNLQGSNVPMTSSPPQPSNILPDTQQPPVVQQHPQQHSIQSQMQPSMQESDGSMNPNGLPNGNGQHYHHTLPHGVQGVAMNHVPSAANVVNNNVTDSSAYSNTIPNHNPAMPPPGSSYQSSMSQQQQQQQQYYNNTGVMTDFHGGIQSRPVSVASTPSITTQQQQSISSQQPGMTNQQQPRPSMTNPVPIVQNQAPTQSLGQIGQQPSISQHTSVPHVNQTMSTSQIHQPQAQGSQPSHLPAQSLPHGAHAQMTGTGSISNATTNSSPAAQPQAAQSLGHSMLQQNKPAYMNQPQSQTPSQNQFQQQQPSQQQQMMQGSQQCIDGQQNVYPTQQVNHVSQNPSNQPQQQPQTYQQGVMMQNIPPMQQQQQQVHVQQMNTQGINQHQQMQQNQPGAQGQGMYPPPGQMMGHSLPMNSQPMNIQQPPQQLIQQQMPNQQIMQQQQQPQIVGQQHHQQMMGMPPQPQTMVSQPQTNAPQQPMMTPQQIMPPMMQQSTQMSGVVTQTPMVSQPGMMSQQPGMIPSQTNIQQPNMIQQMSQQPSYPPPTQPQTINSQQPMQQPIMQPYPQQQANPLAQQQQMMQPPNQSNIMAPQMGQSMTPGQQIPVQQQSQPQSNPQPQQPPQVSIPPQASQQNVFQNSTQQMQVSQANMVQNMSNLQQVHPILPPSSQSIPQLQTSTGIPVQSNEASNIPASLANQDNSSQQQPQPIVQQVQPTPMPVSSITQVQTNQAAVPSPAEIHQTSQPQTVANVPPPVSANSAPTPSPAITTASLSAAATVIIDGVNSLSDASTGGNTASEEGDSATGTNTVAIDNKIEQAMDLVKSHLMFAVREEVEVLKEKISELMERISQLEYENSILRANATQETLAQLQKSTPAPNVNEGHQGFS